MGGCRGVHLVAHEVGGGIRYCNLIIHSRSNWCDKSTLKLLFKKLNCITYCFYAHDTSL